MQRNTERDESLERMLRQTLREAPASDAVPAKCLDAETLAAWTEGGLPPTDVVLVEAHLSDCARCQAFIATLARTMPAPAGAGSFSQRWRLRWLVPIAAAATAVAIWVAVPTDQPGAVLRESDVPLAPARPSIEPGTPVDAPTSASPIEGRQDTANRVTGGASPGAIRPSEQEADAAEPSGAREEPPANVIPGDQKAADSAARSAEAAAASPAPPPTATLERREAILLGQARAPVEIISPDPVNRWRVLAGTRVERSTTGGSTWEAITMNVPGELTAGSSPDPLVCWLVGRAGTVRLTVDGLRFDSVPFPEGVDLVNVRASSATSALITTADGRQFRTDDRGKTWSRVIP